ncbi:hypothetical protein [uncultured Ruminococcus sp.]|uniref:hypothetical protein n=1 Tax=uncultured Ruminococcus sp. TaxID=165186 RepID=UPI002615AAE8|nr:hypothetical protein [uncultured Ruminococcus sp.]
MKKKSKSILAIVLAILLLLVVAVTLTTNILFSRSDTPKFFGHYIYLMESDVMEANSGAVVATGVTSLDDSAAGLQEGVTDPSQPVDSASAAASIHQHTAVIASAYDESDPIAKNNAVLCVLAPDDTSTDVDSERIAVRRIYNIEQDETGVLKYYPTTMQTSAVGTEPPITVDSILGKCTYESGELYSYIKFATGVPGILALLVLPSVILVIMLIVAIARANSRHDDEFAFEESYDEVYSEDSYDSDSAYDDEELGGRSPLFRPSDAAPSRSFERKRSSIAENFERKAVNPNSPYQKARTMQFKAQHDVPIYTNPEDQIPLGGNAQDNGYQGSHAGTVSNTSTFGTRSNTSTFGTGAISHAADTPISEEPVSTYRGSHEASSPEEARNLGSSRLSSGSSTRSTRPAAPTQSSASRRNKYETASVDELLAMIEDEKKKLDK